MIPFILLLCEQVRRLSEVSLGSLIRSGLIGFCTTRRNHHVPHSLFTPPFWLGSTLYSTPKPSIAFLVGSLFAFYLPSTQYSQYSQYPTIHILRYSSILSSACTTTGAPERLHNTTANKTSPSTTVLADQKANFTSLASPPRSSPNSVLRPQNKATMATVTNTISLPNVGVFTDPEHKLWVAESGPTLDSVKKGQDLKEGEVTVGIKSTGICGYAASHPLPQLL